ncbi:MAG TPA: tetratricopeptide repeat protein [Kofleriaceae bacterium]|nr:tetratricopeptide repeat protein [Kofleriaceae bacterium]
MANVRGILGFTARRSLLGATLGTLLTVAGVPAASADVATARDRLAAGDYPGAEAQLQKPNAAEKIPAAVVTAQLHYIRGNYKQALAALAPGLAASDPAARILRAGILRAQGNYDEARKDLEALAAARPDDHVARRLLIAVMLDRGDRAAADVLIKKTDGEYSSKSKKLDLDNTDDLFLLAEVARANGEHELANSVYEEIQKINPKQTEANLRWAELFIDKYASSLAEQTVEDTFKVNPNDPDAHALMAQITLETSYDLQVVRKHLDAAFAVNPNHVGALLARASIEIDRNEWPKALATIAKVTAVNPNSVEAITLRATVAWLRDDLPGYEAERKRVLAINPAYYQFYRTVARSAVREHRYVQANELNKAAIALDPKAYDAMGDLGLGYLRLGMETEGVEWLNKAWQGDQYNVRTFNTRDLFAKTIAREYTLGKSKSFKIRYHADERPVLSRYLEPTMEQAFADMSKRYGFTPKTPVTLELYKDRSDYSIRTTGLPDLGALGVCFGQVITAMSPSNGDINWGMVLWHELGHVFAIQLSNSRVPRWFTEGLSEYETLRARPEWRRENDADLYGAMANGTLPSIADLNAEFMQPDTSAVVVAYYLSAVTIEYLVQTYGFEKIVEALKLYGKGKANADVLATITGKNITQLDAAFRQYLGTRLAAYKGTFKLPTRGFDDLTKLEIAVDAAPKDAKAKANLALGHYYAGDAEHAVGSAKAALALDPKQPLARYIIAEATLSAGDASEAQSLYSALIADRIDNYDIRSKLALIAQKSGNAQAAEAQLCKAKQLDPERSYPYQALAEMYEQRGDTTKQLQELEHYAGIEQMELAPLKTLVAGYGKLERWDKVRTYGEMAMFINPADPDVLLTLGKAYVGLGKGEQALFTFDTALLVKPEVRRPALVHLGRARALALLGKKADAKAALALAANTEPENADIIKLKAELK